MLIMKSELREVINEVLGEHIANDAHESNEIVNDILDKCIDRFDVIENDEDDDEDESDGI